jgi:hypothetical protein
MSKQTRNIRTQEDLQYLMLHHSEHTTNILGQEINRGFVQQGFFGMPQDVVVNMDGTIDLSPRWVRTIDPNQYTVNVPLYTLFKYPLHDISDSCVIANMNYIAMHLLVIGDFNTTNPTIAQLSTVGKLITFISKKLPNFKDVVYHSDFVAIACPGSNFPPVQYWRNYFVSS